MSRIRKLLNKFPPFKRLMTEIVLEEVETRFSTREAEISSLSLAMQGGEVVIEESKTPLLTMEGMRLISPSGVHELECHHSYASLFEDAAQASSEELKCEFVQKYGFARDDAFDTCWNYLQSISNEFVIATHKTSVSLYGDWNLALSSTKCGEVVVAMLALRASEMELEYLGPNAKQWQAIPFWTKDAPMYLEQFHFSPLTGNPKTKTNSRLKTKQNFA